MEPWSINTLLLVLAGGIFGAAMGTLWAVIICALIIIFGSLIVLGGGADFILLQVGVGPIFGPHTGSFAAPIAAACYAAYIKKHPSGSAKDILSPLLDTSWDVLLVGGIFALLGHILLNVAAAIPVLNQSDMLAVSVVGTNILARLFFQKEAPWGRRESIDEHGYLGTNNYRISWAGWQAPIPFRILLGLSIGLMSGGIAWGLQQQVNPLAEGGIISAGAAATVPLIIPWAIAIFALIPLMLGTGPLQKVPVFHCVAILGALGYLYTDSIVMAGLAGILGAFLQELGARMFFNHGTTHIDPPAVGIAIGTFIINLLFKPQFLNLMTFFTK
ncbi:hypothetical protein [Clostridium formicaceticum]|uniref:DUF7973 domain-containing protein n=1 Tax=Clostridium formicaceticum TaxID=1497 RepID=A0AAC9RP04_9CLOT|nr:hypothetical protein [Clostridium formicaceticum]AOY74635.1 hypothetical protein BJL90_00885 [Clostridium formicaceticum]ARE89002.1 hypothetical protein CLFO_34080 [Clostridium formicaceticum]